MLGLWHVSTHNAGCGPLPAHVRPTVRAAGRTTILFAATCPARRRSRRATRRARSGPQPRPRRPSLPSLIPTAAGDMGESGRNGGAGAPSSPGPRTDLEGYLRVPRHLEQRSARHPGRYLAQRSARRDELTGSGDWRGGHTSGLASPAAPPLCHRWGISPSTKCRRQARHFGRPSSGGSPAPSPACHIASTMIPAVTAARPRRTGRRPRGPSHGRLSWQPQRPACQGRWAGGGAVRERGPASCSG